MKPTVLTDFFQKRPAVKCVNGELILYQEKWYESIFMVKSGYIKIYAIGSKGNKHVHVIYTTGDIFPFTWVFTGKTKQLYYESMGTAYVYRANMHEFKDFVSQNHEASYAAFQRLVRQYATYTDRVENLERSIAYQRVGHCLVLFGQRYGEPQVKGTGLDPAFNHVVISESVNLARETVSRAVERLEAKGLIVYGPKRQLIITDMKGLKKESGLGE